MSYSLKVFSSYSNHTTSEVLISPKMRPLDMIPLLRIQSKGLKENEYGLMITTGNSFFRWLPGNMPFSAISFNKDNIFFAEPYFKTIQVNFPDGSHYPICLSMKDKLKTIVRKICNIHKIWPSEIWGAFMIARNEKVLMIPEYSIAEQAPLLEEIYLQQYIFPIIPVSLQVSNFFNPIHMYIIQYRKMIIDKQFDLTNSDISTLNQYPWYIYQDAQKEKISGRNDEAELRDILSLHSFGEIRFNVRFHIKDSKNKLHSQHFRTLTISQNFVAISSDKNSENRLVHSFSTICSLGISDSFLKISFLPTTNKPQNGDENENLNAECWYITHHRCCEIYQIIIKMMNGITLIPSIEQQIPLNIPEDEIIPEPEYISFSETNLSSEDLIKQLFNKLIESYAEFNRLKIHPEKKYEYGINKLKLERVLSRFENLSSDFLNLVGTQGYSNMKKINYGMRHFDSPDFKVEQKKELESLLSSLNDAIFSQSTTENMKNRNLLNTVFHSNKRKGNVTLDPKITKNHSNEPLKETKLPSILHYNSIKGAIEKLVTSNEIEKEHKAWNDLIHTLNEVEMNGESSPLTLKKARKMLTYVADAPELIQSTLKTIAIELDTILPVLQNKNQGESQHHLKKIENVQIIPQKDITLDSNQRQFYNENDENEVFGYSISPQTGSNVQYQKVETNEHPERINLVSYAMSNMNKSELDPKTNSIQQNQTIEQNCNIPTNNYHNEINYSKKGQISSKNASPDQQPKKNRDENLNPTNLEGSSNMNGIPLPNQYVFQQPMLYGYVPYTMGYPIQYPPMYSPKGPDSPNIHLEVNMNGNKVTSNQESSRKKLDFSGESDDGINDQIVEMNRQSRKDISKPRNLIEEDELEFVSLPELLNQIEIKVDEYTKLEKGVSNKQIKKDIRSLIKQLNKSSKRRDDKVQELIKLLCELITLNFDEIDDEIEQIFSIVDQIRKAQNEQKATTFRNSPKVQLSHRIDSSPLKHLRNQDIKQNYLAIGGDNEDNELLDAFHGLQKSLANVHQESQVFTALNSFE